MYKRQGYGNGFGYSGSDGVYSEKALHSEELTLPALDLTKQSAAADLSLLHASSHGSELSGFGLSGHETLDSLPLHHTSSDSLHGDKELSNDSENQIKSLLYSSSAALGTVEGTETCLLYTSRCV